MSFSPCVLCQTDQADFLPHPRKCDTVSQPVTAWNSGSARHLDGPSRAERVWIGMSRIFFPLPRQTHNSDSPSDEKKVNRHDDHITVDCADQYNLVALISWYQPQCGYMAEDQTRHLVCWREHSQCWC